MDIAAYIESGNLEAFVLGILPETEMAQVQAYIARYPELAKEAAAIEDALLNIAMAEAVTPPPEMKDKIWGAIQAKATPHLEISDKEAAEKQGALILPLSPNMRHTRFSQAAVWAALVGSLALNTMFWYQNSQQKKESLAMNTRMDSMQNNQQKLLAVVDNYTKGKNMMADNDMQTIVMHTVLKGHPMAATLYWSKDKAEAYVMMDGLPEPPKGMQYQLWVMQDGKPVDMGVLPNTMANTALIQKVGKPVGRGEAFAISLEKEGGVPSPTMENIYVMGKS